MKKKLIICFLFYVALILTLLIPQQNLSPKAELKNDELTSYQKLTALLKNERILSGAAAGVSIRSAETGELLYDYNGGARLRPASNMKLLTAAAALSKLGENYRFTTEIWLDGKKEGKTLKGNLYLKGKGDPTLLIKDLQEFSKKIKMQGIERIEGNVIGDDSWYDNVRYSQDMIWSDEEAYYGSQISALTISPNKDFDAGTVILEIEPGAKIGDSAKISLSPGDAGYISIENKLTTISPDSTGEIKTKREHGENKIIVEGAVPLYSKPHREWVSVWEPGEWTVRLFKQALLKEGVAVNGSVSMGTVPKDARRIISRSSIPLSELLKPFLMLSNNGHADILVKEMGKIFGGEGSFEAGLEVLKTELLRYGFVSDDFMIRDGSGISHLTLITANQLSSFLYQIQKENWFPVFLKALPEAGNKERFMGGTLRNRFNGSPVAGQVRAKTGTLTSVTSISGYMTTKTGKKLIFSIFLNNLINEDEGKKLEDKMIEILWNQ